MDFYHVLPSNTSPNHFPKNHASKYSTPLDNPYELSGKWEVALMDLTYSTCVNTFDNDKLVVREETSLVHHLKKTNGPLKVMIPTPSSKDTKTARLELISYINEIFKGLIQVQIQADGKHASWKPLNKNYYYILSDTLANFFQLWGDVVTSSDGLFYNVYKFKHDKIHMNKTDLYLIIIPKKQSENHTCESIILKKENEEITHQELIDRFKSKVDPEVATLQFDADKNLPKKFNLIKKRKDNKLIVLNADFRAAMTFPRAAMYRPYLQKFFSSEFENLAPPWIFTIISIKKVELYKAKTSTTEITLPPTRFVDINKAIEFVNGKINDDRISFGCKAKSHVTLDIKDPCLTLTLDDNLRDIFALDQNTFSGELSITAKGQFSLYRCIDYLFIYSNISDYIRVGNTEAPLLAIVPFKYSQGCVRLKEKSFKNPMYINISRDHISQIDIGIYDGAGKLIPFLHDAVTTLRLHFRQI